MTSQNRFVLKTNLLKFYEHWCNLKGQNGLLNPWQQRTPRRWSFFLSEHCINAQATCLNSSKGDPHPHIKIRSGDDCCEYNSECNSGILPLNFWSFATCIFHCTTGHHEWTFCTENYNPEVPSLWEIYVWIVHRHRKVDWYHLFRPLN